MVNHMNRPVLFVAISMLSAAAAGAQQGGTYQGVSRPPADDQIITDQTPEAKPPAGHYATQPAAPVYTPPAPSQYAQPAPPPAYVPPQPTSVDPSANFPMDGTDNGIVRVAPHQEFQGGPDQRVRERMTARNYANDPDGDIVHPHPLRPGEVGEGTMIRVRLLDRLSTADSQRGEPFRTRVSSDVMQDGRVVIPAGAEIDGQIVQVSRGHAGGYGTMRLEPETVIMSDGSRFRIHAQVEAAMGARARVVGEGTVRADSRLKRDGIEYGGAVGAGVIVGAVVAGGPGALAGGLIGAGAVTVHLLVNHPQATLDSGTVLRLMLTERLALTPQGWNGN